MTVPQPTAILIVGMHRSGTSALAGVLHKLGIPLGERLLKPAADNPKGYWEHEDVVAVHERLWAALGSRWDDVRPLPEDWLQGEPARLATAAIGEIVSRDFSGETVWSVKDPRLCRALPLWFDVLAKHATRAVVLFIVRKPSEVSASIQARNHWHPLVGKLLWLRYMTEAVLASRGVARGVVLYDDLLTDPISTVTGALASMGVASDGGISTDERQAVAGFIDTADRHHTNSGSKESLTVFESIADEIYQSFAAVAHGTKEWNTVEQATAAFDREWMNSGACISAVADMAARIEADGRAARVENAKVTSALNAQVRWSEEALVRREALQAEAAELSSKLTAQIRWSEEAQADREALREENAKLSSRLVERVSEHERLRSEFGKLSQESQALSARQQKMALETVRARERMAAQLRNVLAERDHAAAELRGVHSSMSWKLTKPLRAAAGLFRHKVGPAHSSPRKSE